MNRPCLARIRVVLVGTLYGGNVGSVCRAMANCGVRDLRLVAPDPGLSWDEARKMAVHADDVLAARRVHATLAEAVSDCAAVVGTSRRGGLYRRHFADSREAAPELVATAAAGGPVALVFGREDKGLLNEELLLCTHVVQIPASPDYPSYNLAQAVLLLCHEVFRAASGPVRNRELENSPLASADLRARLGRIVVAYSKSGRPVTTRDLEVDGAMCALLVNACKPTLMQSIEGQPVFVHAGPFANIAIGQNSVVADRLACALGDYVVTESGFAADMGFEKFWNIKCRCSGLKPDAVVLVATVRALKAHGGAPAVKAGLPLDPVYTTENLDLLREGCDNLLAHIDIIRRSGVQPVVCLNAFYTDTPAERALVREIAEAAGAAFAVSDHWLKGGEGALELAQAVVDACDRPNSFAFLSEPEEPLAARAEKLVREVYGGDGVDWSETARAKIEALQADPGTARLPICMAKTQYSLSHDPKLLGRPKGWRLPVRDVLVYKGAGLVVPVAGEIKLMPGTSASPAYRRIDVDTSTGRVRGLY